MPPLTPGLNPIYTKFLILSMNWKKLSVVSIWSAGIIAILESFLGKYLPKHMLAFMIVDGLALLIFIVSETIRYLIKNRLKKENTNE